MYHLYVKRKGCQGKSCRRCEDFFPGFFEEHGGDMMFSTKVLVDQASLEMVTGAIDNCPAGVIGWDEI